MRLRLSFLGAAMLVGLATTVLAQQTLKVGLIGEPACTDAKSREAAWKVLTGEPTFKVDRLTSAAIHAGEYAKYDVLIFPGGAGNTQAKMLGLDGGAQITEYVKNGKGLIGICAGGYLVAEGWNPLTKAIELINAELWDLDNWARGEQFIAVKVVGEDDAASSRTMWFENGPVFVPAQVPALPKYTVLVKYETDLAAKNAPKGMMTGRDAVIAAPMKKGRVVAFGPHPELSPGLNHWLVNAVKWAAAGDDGTSPSVASVLEGRQ